MPSCQRPQNAPRRGRRGDPPGRALPGEDRGDRTPAGDIRRCRGAGHRGRADDRSGQASSRDRIRASAAGNARIRPRAVGDGRPPARRRESGRSVIPSRSHARHRGGVPRCCAPPRGPEQSDHGRGHGVGLVGLTSRGSDRGAAGRWRTTGRAPGRWPAPRGPASTPSRTPGPTRQPGTRRAYRQAAARARRCRPVRTRQTRTHH